MSFWDDMLGRKPKPPEVPELSLPEEQKKAVAANLAIAPEAAKLAEFSQEQITKMMEMAIPGFTGMLGKTSGNIQALLRGEIPLDVSTEVKRQGAARSLSGGFGGTGAASNLVARDLGLTSLGIQREGRTSFESWLGKMEQLYSPSQALFTGMMITPQQQFAAATQERDIQAQQDWLTEQIEAMPSPGWAAFKEAVQSAISIYSGAQVTPSPYSTKGGWGNGGGGGGRGSGNAGGGINWSASDWSSDPTTDTPYDWSGNTPKPSDSESSDTSTGWDVGAFGRTGSGVWHWGKRAGKG